MPSPHERRVEMWLPVNQTKVTVVDGEVKVWDEMTMEKRLVQKPAGFATEERQDAVEDRTA